MLWLHQINTPYSTSTHTPHWPLTCSSSMLNHHQGGPHALPHTSHYDFSFSSQASWLPLSLLPPPHLLRPAVPPRLQEDSWWARPLAAAPPPNLSFSSSPFLTLRPSRFLIFLHPFPYLIFLLPVLESSSPPSPPHSTLLSHIIFLLPLSLIHLLLPPVASLLPLLPHSSHSFISLWHL